MLLLLLLYVVANGAVQQLTSNFHASATIGGIIEDFATYPPCNGTNVCLIANAQCPLPPCAYCPIAYGPMRNYPIVSCTDGGLDSDLIEYIGDSAFNYDNIVLDSTRPRKQQRNSVQVSAAGPRSHTELHLLLDGKGGTDLTYNGTRNSIAVRALIEDDIRMDFIIYDTNNIWERHRVILFKTGPGGVLVDAVFVIRNQSILANVDAIEVYTGHNPATFYFYTLDYIVNLLQTATTPLGCRYTDTFAYDEFTPVPGGLMPPEEHLEYINRPSFSNRLSNISVGGQGPLTVRTRNYNRLPFGNVFSFYDPVAIGTMTFRYLPPSLPNIAIPANGYPLPMSSVNVLIMDFDSLNSGNLFRTINVTEQITNLFFGDPLPCLVGPAVGFRITPLGATLTPIGPPIAVPLTISLFSMDGSVFYDAGANLLRAIQIDYNSASCAVPNGGFELYVFAVKGYTLTADGPCLPPTEPVLCRNIRGRAYFDANSNGQYDSGEAFLPQTLVTIDVLGDPHTHYYTISEFNGTYITDCLPVDTPMTITIVNPVGQQVLSDNNPQVYIGDAFVASNVVPDVRYGDANGLLARVYNDVNNNGAQDLFEPGLIGIPATATPVGGIDVRSNVTDMYGNLIIDEVPTGITLFDIVNHPLLFGWVLTQGMDPISLNVTMMPNRTIIGPFGYHFPSLGSVCSPVYLDQFDGLNNTITAPPTTQQLYLTRLVTISGNSRWTTRDNGVSAGAFMSIADGRLTVEYNFPSPIDMTNNGTATSVTLEFIAVFGNADCAMFVNNNEESQQQSLTTDMNAATFYYVNATVYQNVSRIAFICQSTADNTTIIIDYISTECATCVATTYFDALTQPVGYTTNGTIENSQLYFENTAVFIYDVLIRKVILDIVGGTPNCTQIQLLGDNLVPLPAAINTVDAGSNVVRGFRNIGCPLNISAIHTTTDGNDCNTLLNRTTTIVAVVIKTTSTTGNVWWIVLVSTTAALTLICCCYWGYGAKRLRRRRPFKERRQYTRF
jgi:hypothetical protein